MLIETEVYITLHCKNIKYYEDLGYEIPRYKNVAGRMVIKRGTKIIVKVCDLTKGSHVKVKAKCDCCGKEYEITYKNYLTHNHNGRTYCNECSNTVLLSGENNPNWNPNRTQEERENGRDYPEYKEFIKKVLARDNYTCKCCGKKSNGDANIHHLNGYDWDVEHRTDEINRYNVM